MVKNNKRGDMRNFHGNEFHAFSKYDGHGMFEKQRSAIEQEIKSQSDDYILNINRDEYIQHLISQYSITPIELFKEELTVSTHEEMIPAENHPLDVIVYHLPFSGKPELLQVRASSWSTNPPLISVEEGCICFRIINFNLEPAQIKQQSENTIQSIESLTNSLTQDIIKFNASVEQAASQSFDSRKQQLLKKNDMIAALGVPIKRNDSTLSTFSIPAKRIQAIASKPKPQVSEKGYKPEPTIDDSIYIQILQFIHDVGKQFERLPSTYNDKEEEHLRDHILLILEPNFQGSATGETFNKAGKTDILLRHEGKNVFIAELKFWHGKKSFLDTITQLLGYLTWRDSKAAVVMFVKNKDFMSVLNTAKESILEHPNHLGFVSEKDESWLQYRFHINDDKNREVKLAVMLFHIPE